MTENKRVLIVDDDDGIRETYLGILKARAPSGILSEGEALFADLPPSRPAPSSPSYEVVLVEDGIRGVAAVRQAVQDNRPFAVAFIDMKMPGLNGAQTAGQIWDIDPGVKIVIVTAYSDHSPEEIIETTGRDDLFYLRKPFNREEILQFARALTNEWNLEKKRAHLETALKQANQALEEMNQDLEEKVRKQAAMIVQTEKMATVGLLAAGVAHEINNPISFINSNLVMLGKYSEQIRVLYDNFLRMEAFVRASDSPGAEPLLEETAGFKTKSDLAHIMGDLKELVSESLEGVDRVKTIVQDLKTFSRIEEAEFSRADINAAIETALKMIWNEIKYSVTIEKDLGDLPEVLCHPQKLTQVFMNLLINAAQAIEDRGTVSISTRLVPLPEPDEGPAVCISIADTGSGIPREHMDKLFDPFFTTKPVGLGTGLGLSIVYEIIKSHRGSIRVESSPGRGTRFDITIPASPEPRESGGADDGSSLHPDR